MSWFKKTEFEDDVGKEYSNDEDTLEYPLDPSAESELILMFIDETSEAELLFKEYKLLLINGKCLSSDILLFRAKSNYKTKCAKASLLFL